MKQTISNFFFIFLLLLVPHLSFLPTVAASTTVTKSKSSCFVGGRRGKRRRIPEVLLASTYFNSPLSSQPPPQIPPTTNTQRTSAARVVEDFSLSTSSCLSSSPPTKKSTSSSSSAFLLPFLPLHLYSSYTRKQYHYYSIATTAAAAAASIRARKSHCISTVALETRCSKGKQRYHNFLLPQLFPLAFWYRVRGGALGDDGIITPQTQTKTQSQEQQQQPLKILSLSESRSGVGRRKKQQDEDKEDEQEDEDRVYYQVNENGDLSSFRRSSSSRSQLLQSSLFAAKSSTTSSSFSSPSTSSSTSLPSSSPPPLSSSSPLQHLISRSTTLARRFRALLHAVFLPAGYPHTVAPEYLTYQGWNVVQDLTTYLRGILATQALFEGVGVGKAGATSLAATVQWMMRDGTSMLSGLVFTSLLSANFGNQIKGWRLFADVMVDLGITLEMMAPVFPRHFLLLICLASVFKCLCGIAAGATNGAITQHWSTVGGSNVADIVAKGGAQHTVVSLVGLGLGMAFARLCSTLDTNLSISSKGKGRGRLYVWVAYSFLTLLHLAANYQAMRVLALRSLNRGRLSLLLHQLLLLSPLHPAVNDNRNDNDNVYGNGHLNTNINAGGVAVAEEDVWKYKDGGGGGGGGEGEVNRNSSSSLSLSVSSLPTTLSLPYVASREPIFSFLPSFSFSFFLPSLLSTSISTTRAGLMFGRGRRGCKIRIGVRLKDLGLGANGLASAAAASAASVVGSSNSSSSTSRYIISIRPTSTTSNKWSKRQRQTERKEDIIILNNNNINNNMVVIENNVVNDDDNNNDDNNSDRSGGDQDSSSSSARPMTSIGRVKRILQSWQGQGQEQGQSWWWWWWQRRRQQQQAQQQEKQHRRRNRSQGRYVIAVALEEGATPEDQLLAYLQASLLSYALTLPSPLPSSSSSSSSLLSSWLLHAIPLLPPSDSISTGTSTSTSSSCKNNDNDHQLFLPLLQASRTNALNLLPLLKRLGQEAGWEMERLLLGPEGWVYKK